MRTFVVLVAVAEAVRLTVPFPVAVALRLTVPFAVAVPVRLTVPFAVAFTEATVWVAPT